jgi:hypothetical protein
MSTENKEKPTKEQDKGTSKGGHGGCGCGHSH